MPIVEFSSLLYENKKKSSDKILPLVGIELMPCDDAPSYTNLTCVA